MFIYGSFIVTLFPYWIVNILLLILDIRRAPQFLYKYKIQDTEKVNGACLSHVQYAVHTYTCSKAFYSKLYRTVKSNIYNVQNCYLFQLEWDRLRNAVIRVLTNQTIVSLPVIVLNYWLMCKRGCDFHGKLPPFPSVVWELFVCIWVLEVEFYYSHRLDNMRHMWG